MPDVWLSLLARSSLKAAIVACFYALAGALLGGMLVYGLASLHPATVTRLIEKIPAISPGMIARVRLDLEQQGVWAMVAGPLQGIPYKIFASQVPQAGISLTTFLVYSIPARLLRFLAVAVACFAGVRILERWRSRRFALNALILAWVVFYALYFWRMPNH